MSESMLVEFWLPMHPVRSTLQEFDSLLAAQLQPPRREPFQYSETELLTELELAQRDRNRAEARWLSLLAEAEARETTLHQTALPTHTWLTEQNTHSARTAIDETRLATGLSRWQPVAHALAAGELSVEQARVIVRGLERLPDDLDGTQREGVAAQLVAFAAEFGPHALARLVNRAVEVVAPEAAEDADRRAVERLEAAQTRDRYLAWRRGPDGELNFRGRLGKVAGEHLLATLRSLASSQRSAAALAGETLTRQQANADALTTLVDHFASCGQAPRYGADRPRILVSVDLETLRGRLGTATLLNTGDQLTAQEVRRLACDAGILPVVMGGGSVPLDVGREKRLFEGPLRTLLIGRDRGCAFPGCDRGPADCEAHHIIPWWNGGRTSLANGVLLCPFHHHLVEPDPHAPPEQHWQIRLDSRGDPELGAPVGRGAPPGQRRWRQHHRYRT